MLNYDQLHTALTEVQAVINARPLVYVSDEADEWRPLTPSNLLTGYPPQGGLPEPPPNPADFASAKEITKMDEARRTFVSECTNRFVKEYLGELLLFHSKGKPTKKIRIGEVVVVHDANAKRLMWTTGVVKERLKGRDGIVRSVKLKTPNGNIITRAIQCLYPIELQEDQPEADHPGPVDDDTN